MTTLANWFRQPIQIAQTLWICVAQAMRGIRLRLHFRMSLAAEHLCLKQQIELYEAPKGYWRRDMNTVRFTLVWLSYWFDLQPALIIAQPETFKRWRRHGWRLLRKPTAKPGRLPIPPDLQALVRRMARENVAWGQQRIANELSLKHGLRVSPQTVRKDTPSDCVDSPGRSRQSQRWSTFSRNHAKGLVFTDVRAGTVRAVLTMLDRIQHLRQSLRNWVLQRASSPIKTPRHPVMIDHDEAFGILGVTALKRAKPMRGVERSAPEHQLLRHPESMSAAASLPAVGVEACSVLLVRCRQVLVQPTEQHIASAPSVKMPADL